MISKEEINAALGKGLTQTQLDALHNARVAVVGLGGLGSNIAVAGGIDDDFCKDRLSPGFVFDDDAGQPA